MKPVATSCNQSHKTRSCTQFPVSHPSGCLFARCVYLTQYTAVDLHSFCLAALLILVPSHECSSPLVFSQYCQAILVVSIFVSWKLLHATLYVFACCESHCVVASPPAPSTALPPLSTHNVLRNLQCELEVRASLSFVYNCGIARSEIPLRVECTRCIGSYSLPQCLPMIWCSRPDRLLRPRIHET